MHGQKNIKLPVCVYVCIYIYIYVYIYIYIYIYTLSGLSGSSRTAKECVATAPRIDLFPSKLQ